MPRWILDMKAKTTPIATADIHCRTVKTLHAPTPADVVLHDEQRNETAAQAPHLSGEGGQLVLQAGQVQRRVHTEGGMRGMGRRGVRGRL